MWRVPLDAPAGAEADAVLSAAERARAARFRFARDRRRWMASRVALRRILAGYVARGPGVLEITEGEHGKPRLSDSEVRFNLAHSDGLGLIALTRDREVGVDVERIRDGLDFLALARRALAPSNARMLEVCLPAERPRIFYPAWVAEEARRKCLGVGLAALPQPTPAVAPVPLAVDPAYAAALAVAGTRPPSCVTVRAWLR